MDYLIDPQELFTMGKCPKYVEPCTIFCQIKPLYGVPPAIPAD